MRWAKVDSDVCFTRKSGVDARRRCAKSRDGVSYLALYRAFLRIDTGVGTKETGFCVIPSRVASSTCLHGRWRDGMA